MRTRAADIQTPPVNPPSMYSKNRGLELGTIETGQSFPFQSFSEHLFTFRKSMVYWFVKAFALKGVHGTQKTFKGGE
ncbi:hypothetical protein HFA01_31670 [Halobacillus faecis]|uniref:Uncharacterized protein n=1 Tax=Halobacillus faecis TaxID=360184 RepID=A0A511WUS5_9BACI|nr:hypothetical protein HFA01_31670 [Halobacillus faecis]